MGYTKPVPDHIPFWSEVITINDNSVSISASGSTSISISASVGETWLIKLNAQINTDANGSEVVFRRYDESSGTYRYLQQFKTGGSYGSVIPHLYGEFVITDDLYIDIQATNKYTATRNLLYGYSGFKLGTRKAEFEEIETGKLIQGERLSKYKIKSEFEGLEDLIRDVYDDTIDDYKQVIYFYRDKPIRKDKKTGHIIERASSYIETDKLIENLGKVKTGELQLEKTGYKSWLDKIKKERGIDLLVRL